MRAIRPSLLLLFALQVTPVMSGPLDCFAGDLDPSTRQEACTATVTEPSNDNALRARAHLVRSELRRQNRELDGALADIEAAEALGGIDVVPRMSRARLTFFKGRSESCALLFRCS